MGGLGLAALGMGASLAAPWIMRTLPKIFAKRGAKSLGESFGMGSAKEIAAYNRKKLLQQAGRIANPLHGGTLARGAKGGAYGLGGAYGIDAMFGGQAAPEVGGVQGTHTGTAGRVHNTPWSPSEGLMSARDAKRLQSETFWGNMNKMMQMSAILNATGGDTKGFQEMMTLANKKILSDMGDKRDMDIYDSVFKKGNMPNTAIEAYERVIASGGGEDRAAKIAGQYVKMRDLRVNKTEAVTRVMQAVNELVLGGQIEQAKARFKNALAYGEIKSDYFKDPLGNTLSGAELDKRIDEMIIQMSSGVQEAG